MRTCTVPGMRKPVLRVGPRHLLGVAALATEVGARDNLRVGGQAACGAGAMQRRDVAWVGGRGCWHLPGILLGKGCLLCAPRACTPHQLAAPSQPAWMRSRVACMAVSLGMKVSTSCSVSRCRPPSIASSLERVSCGTARKADRNNTVFGRCKSVTHAN